MVLRQGRQRTAALAPGSNPIQRLRQGPDPTEPRRVIHPVFLDRHARQCRIAIKNGRFGPSRLHGRLRPQKRPPSHAGQKWAHEVNFESKNGRFVPSWPHGRLRPQNRPPDHAGQKWPQTVHFCCKNGRFGPSWSHRRLRPPKRPPSHAGQKWPQEVNFESQNIVCGPHGLIAASGPKTASQPFRCVGLEGRASSRLPNLVKDYGFSRQSEGGSKRIKKMANELPDMRWQV